MSLSGGYRAIIETHLIPSLGRRQLAAIEGPDLADYIRAKDQAGLGPATINRHLNLLHKLYEDARCDRGLVRSNPAKDVRRPREPRRRHRALKPDEIAAVMRAFGELEQNEWTRQVRTMFLVHLATACGAARCSGCGEGRLDRGPGRGDADCA